MRASSLVRLEGESVMRASMRINYLPGWDQRLEQFGEKRHSDALFWSPQHGVLRKVLGDQVIKNLS